MSTGRITYLKGRPTIGAGVYTLADYPNPLTDGHWNNCVSEIEKKLVGRELSPGEKEGLREMVDECYAHEFYRGDRNKFSEIGASGQDIKRTLIALSRLSPAQAEEKFRTVDLRVEAFIHSALMTRLGFRGDLQKIRPGLRGNFIVRAAAEALKIKIRGGRPARSHHWFYVSICVAWLSFGKKITLGANSDYPPTGLVKFAKVLMNCACLEKMSESGIVAALRDAKAQAIQIFKGRSALREGF